MGSGFPKVSLLERQTQSPRYSLGLLEETWLPFSAETKLPAQMGCGGL